MSIDVSIGFQNTEDLRNSNNQLPPRWSHLKQRRLWQHHRLFKKVLVPPNPNLHLLRKQPSNKNRRPPILLKLLKGVVLLVQQTHHLRQRQGKKSAIIKSRLSENDCMLLSQPASQQSNWVFKLNESIWLNSDYYCQWKYNELQQKQIFFRLSLFISLNYHLLE